MTQIAKSNVLISRRTYASKTFLSMKYFKKRFLASKEVSQP